MLLNKMLCVGVLCASVPLTTLALDFNLFDANRGKAPEQEAPPQPVTPPPAPPPKPPEPPKKQDDFMLLGTQVFGARRVAYLQAPDGKSIRQVLNPKGASPISGYKGYFLREVTARQVKLAYPSEAPCQQHREEKGVKCETKNLAVLSMKRGKPTPPRMPAPVAAQEMPLGGAPPMIDPNNPGSDKAQAFQPRIIKDEEIPPGMKRIRTPFGDRLVPAN